MALAVTLTGTTVTLDETAGLQNDDTSTALPVAFSSRLTALGADPATALNQAVSNGNVISISGVTGTLGNIAFTDANGGALDGDSSGLFTNDGEEIFLFTDTVNDNIVLGKTALGAIAFAVFLEETGSPVSGGKFWSIQYEALEHPNASNPDDSIDLNGNLKVAVSEAINFGFAGAPSGSNLFMIFGDPNSAQIVVIGQDPLNQSEGGNINTKDVLNISQAGGTTSFGVNGNQINPDEGAFITYVTGANTNFLVPNLDQNEADVEANIDFQKCSKCDRGVLYRQPDEPARRTRDGPDHGLQHRLRTGDEFRRRAHQRCGGHHHVGLGRQQQRRPNSRHLD